MQIFTYIAVDSDGRSVSGSKYASGRAPVEHFLLERGFTNAEIFASHAAKRGKGGVSLKELAIFCRMMSVVIISNLSLTEGLQVIAEQMENKNLRITLKEIYKFIDTGYTFSQSMGMYPHIFGAYALNMIAVGETSGTLDDILVRLSLYFDKEDSVRNKLRSAISYPLVLTVLMAAIIVLLIIKIMPMFEATLASMGGQPPQTVSLIFGAANVISRYFLVVIAVLIAIAVIAALYLRTERGRLIKDRLKISAPVFKYINRRIITSRYARGLSILLKSGVQLINAMTEIIALVNNTYLEDRFSDAVERVKKGEDIDGVLNDIRIFPPLFIRLVKIGHAAGHLDEMLERSAVLFDEEVDHAIDQITLTIEPALIIILSLVVGVILLSVMLPMIGIMNAIG